VEGVNDAHCSTPHASRNHEVVEQRNLVKTSAQLNFSLITIMVHLLGETIL